MPPFTIDLAACKKQGFLNVSSKQEQVPDGPLPENWMGTTTRGLPVREIPHYEFPKVVYRHPKKPFRTIEHRNNNFELVGTEKIPTDHLTKAVSCEAHKNGGPKDCADCNKLLSALLAKGWKKEPYIPVAPPTVEDDIYGPDDGEEPAILAAPVPKRSTCGTAENPL